MTYYYLGAMATFSGGFNPSGRQFEVLCTGSESNIGNCPFSEVTGACSSSQRPGVICQGESCGVHAVPPTYEV